MREFSDTQLDILLILSDEKGHALHDLETRLKKPKGNLKKQPLVGLETEEDGESWESLSFRISDIKDPIELANRLHEAKDPLSRYIQDQLPKGLRSFLENYKAQNTQLDYKSKELYSLAFSLDMIIKKQHLFDEQRFAHIQLTTETKGLIEQIPMGLKPLRLNRLLLEEAYPNEIMKSKMSVIYRGTPRKTTRKWSAHPNQLEMPYYINNNLKIFESIADNLRHRKEFAGFDLSQISRLCTREKNRLMVEIGPDEVDKEIYQNTLYKGENIFFYEQEFDRHKQSLQDFIFSQYTGNLIKKFGFGIIDDFLEGIIKNSFDSYIQDYLFEMEIASEACNKGFITEKEFKGHASCLAERMNPYFEIAKGPERDAGFETLRRLSRWPSPKNVHDLILKNRSYFRSRTS
ncbi:MAG: hypothetical protein MUO26_11460 [Methanotrichaceae archaeon]|nr:hypothetical protein [Methanotrichaceae archaeon]